MIINKCPCVNHFGESNPRNEVKMCYRPNRGNPSYKQFNQKKLRHIIRKPAFCHCGNKGADQPRMDTVRYIDSTIHLLPKAVTIFCGITARFMSDLVGNPKDRFSHVAAQLISFLKQHSLVIEEIIVETIYRSQHTGQSMGFSVSIRDRI